MLPHSAGSPRTRNCSIVCNDIPCWSHPSQHMAESLTWAYLECTGLSRGQYVGKLRYRQYTRKRSSFPGWERWRRLRVLPSPVRHRASSADGLPCLPYPDLCPCCLQHPSAASSPGGPALLPLPLPLPLHLVRRPDAVGSGVLASFQTACPCRLCRRRAPSPCEEARRRLGGRLLEMRIRQRASGR